MEKFDRFVVKHLMPLYWIGAFVWLFAISILADRYDIPAVAQFVLWTGGFLAWMRFLVSRANALIKEPIKIFQEQCDPYPYLDEIQKRRTYSGPKAAKLNLLLAETVVMYDLGHYQEAYMLLSPLENDMKATMMRGTLMNYDCQMANVCRSLQKDQEAQAWLQKAREVYEKIKREDRKKQFRDVFLTHDALTLLERQQYTQALQLLEQVAPKTMRERVVLSVNYAWVYLAQGETEKAKEALTFVAENGNKLDIATQARQMLSEMEENTPA